MEQLELTAKQETDKLFFSACVQSWEEFKVGQLYETRPGGAGVTRFICEDITPEQITFRLLGILNKETGNFITSIKLLLVDPRTEPLKWYAGIPVDWSEREKELITVMTNGEIKEKRKQTESSGEPRTSIYAVVKEHLDAGNELDETSFYTFIRENKPDIKEKNIKDYMRNLVNLKYPSKVKIENGKIKSIEPGIDYDL